MFVTLISFSSLSLFGLTLVLLFWGSSSLDADSTDDDENDEDVEEMNLGSLVSDNGTFSHPGISR